MEFELFSRLGAQMELFLSVVGIQVYLSTQYRPKKYEEYPVRKMKYLERN